MPAGVGPRTSSAGRAASGPSRSSRSEPWPLAMPRRSRIVPAPVPGHWTLEHDPGGGGPMTATRETEVELKYRVIDVEAAERVVADHRLADLTATGPARTSQHEDHYVDTADGALARAGFAARLRQAGGATIISIKSLTDGGQGAMHRRVELEGPADRATKPHDWPGS